MSIRQKGMVEVGVAEDLSVSATKYSPFKRPSLGQWLTDRADEWDVLVCWRLDRIIRSSRDLAELLAWCEQHGKGFVSATEGFDLGTPFGKAMVTIIGALGELEAETTRMRVSDAHRKLRTTDRWPSGIPPLGFRVVDHPSGKGRALDTDPEGKRAAHELASRLLSGWSLNALALWFNESDYVTPKGRARLEAGKQPAKWTSLSVVNYLTNPSTQGFKVHTNRGRNPKVVLDDDGEPIRLAPPTFDHDTWEQIQSAVKARQYSGKRRVHTANPMVGVGKCGQCGVTLQQTYRNTTATEYRYYRCSGKPRCRNASIRADVADRILGEDFIELHANDRVVEQRFIPGTDNREEIERTRGALERLRGESDAGLITDDDEYYRRLKALTSRLSELEKEPYRASQWEAVETAETYSDAWKRADVEQRRKMLIAAGVRFVLYSGQPLHWEMQVP